MDESVKHQIILIIEQLRPYESIEIIADKDGNPDTYYYKRWDKGILKPKTRQ